MTMRPAIESPIVCKMNEILKTECVVKYAKENGFPRFYVYAFRRPKRFRTNPLGDRAFGVIAGMTGYSLEEVRSDYFARGGYRSKSHRGVVDSRRSRSTNELRGAAE